MDCSADTYVVAASPVDDWILSLVAAHRLIPAGHRYTIWDGGR